MNQANLLRYIAKSTRSDWVRDEAVSLDELAIHVDSAKDGSTVMELEAQAARHY
jgi:CRISPR/Cas system-associated endonuclease Cas1